jgi:AraC-like DNA-binding protein
MIGARAVAGFAEALDCAGAPADRLLERAGISPSVRDKPQGYLAGKACWTLLAAVSDSQGLREFTFDYVHTLDWRDMGAWARPLARSVTLLDAIRTMAATYPREIPMVELGLTTRGDTAWFWRRRTTDVRGWQGGEAAEQYMLAFMIRLVRLVAGDLWIPSRLKLESPASGWGGTAERFVGSRIEFSQAVLAIGIPRALLCLPIRREDFGTLPLEHHDEPAATSFEGSLRQVVRPLIAWQRPTLEHVSGLVGRSPRTLRRSLAAAGTSWRDLLDDLIFAKATKRLASGRKSISEVAYELGFSSPAHFSRSFSRRAGVPPSVYRSQRQIPASSQ